MSDQSTSRNGSGVAKQWSRMIEDFENDFSGGPALLELAKGHPEVKSRFFAFLHQLADEHASMLPLESRSAWMTIRIGTHKSKTELRMTVEKGGHKLSNWAKDLIYQPIFLLASEERTIDLYRATIAELGFVDDASVRDVYEKLDSLGYCACPDETALQLRLKYKHQPLNEWLLVLTEPVEDADGCLSILAVVNDPRGTMVAWNNAEPEDYLSSEERLVFCRK